MSNFPPMARSLADWAAAPQVARPPQPECDDDPLAAPEWTMPARHVAALALAALVACVALALLG